jgi:hypothetical protein
MAFDDSRLDDYNTVAERITEFREKYPAGCLRPADITHPYRIETIGERSFVVHCAAAYRSPDDPMPGVGTAWEPFPGRTPYTHDSELQNAETAAWGRAIVAVLAADAKKGIATAEDVRNRRADQDSYDQGPSDDATGRTIDLFARIMDAKDDEALRAVWAVLVNDRETGRISDRKANQLAAHVRRKRDEFAQGVSDASTTNAE